MKISAIINTYNEENNLFECLKSIGWVDELIVVDMYSTDHTVEIAKQFTNNIYYHQFTGYVEKARNYAISKAKGEWIIILDADERLNNKDEVIIRKLILQKEIDGYWFPRKNYINQNFYLKYGYFYPDYQLRLFRNNKSVYYRGKIHEQPLIEIEKTQKNNSVEIIHNSTHSKYSSFLAFKNFIPYIKIESENLTKEKISIYNLIFKGLISFIRDFYRSFIRLKGYKDGYFGFRAALLYASYKWTIYSFAAVNKILNNRSK